LQADHELDRTVGIVTTLWARQMRNYGLIPGMGTKTSLLQSIQTGLGTHHASYSVGPGGSTWEQHSQSMKLNTHIHLVPPRLRMSGAMAHLPHITSWCVPGQLYF
jgi:hypothetical protein